MSPESKVISINQLESDIDGFCKLSEYLRRETGINMSLSAKNQTLLASRVSKILHIAGVVSYSQLHSALISGQRNARDLFINAMTTNTTHFFREKQHFDYLARHLPEILNHPEKKKDKELRVWCAACSTGEEAYTIAMQIHSQIPMLAGWKLKILASDIDTVVLKKAARGVYPLEAIESVSETFKEQYFEQGRGQSQGMVRVRKNIRDLITFAPFNLMSQVYTFQSKFDIVFCRNVMIYFDRPEIQQTIKKLEGCLRVGGLLFVGHSETIMGITSGLKSKAPAVYQRTNLLNKGEAA